MPTLSSSVLLDSGRSAEAVRTRVCVNGLYPMDRSTEFIPVDFMNLGADIVALAIWNGTELNKISHLR